jgi:hypothetical protein
MTQSATIGALAAALAKAQTHYGKAIKDAANPFFKSKYVDLAGCYDACREALAAQGLSVVQTTASAGSAVVLISTLIHSSGEWICGEYPVNPVKADPQGYGSAMTYARRYALMALVGLAAEDDDGEAASGRAQKVATATGKVEVKKPKWTEDQRTEAGNLRAEAIELGGEKRFNDLYHSMQYDQPSDFIDKAALLLKELRDIADQANQGVQS